MFDIESVQAMYGGNAVKYTKHFKNRIEYRSIKKSDEGTPLHIAVGVDDDIIWLLTAYKPTLDIWEADYKTRRKGDNL